RRSIIKNINKKTAYFFEVGSVVYVGKINSPETAPKKMCQGRRRAEASSIRQHIPMLVVDTGRC
ncbi:MAG: hypothetical protein NT034_03590, partial [Candidatus Magasanikbacteria bacterium]|nr:hypothetical protein [Candidatus Magasanikbacteria bacterium]